MLSNYIFVYTLISLNNSTLCGLSHYF